MKTICMTLLITLSLVTVALAQAPTTQPATTAPAPAPATQPQNEDGPFTHEQIVDKIYTSYGFDRWDQVETIRWTFADKRHWEWSPKTNRVKMRSVDKNGNETRVTYDRDELTEDSPQEHIRTDRSFINDSFWFLLPLHLQWSDDVIIEDGPTKLAPLGRVITREIVVTYPVKGGGYTPGDVYKLYVDDTWRIQQWTFHRKGRTEPNLRRIWAQEYTLGPIVVNGHFSNGKGGNLYIRNMEVKLVEQNDWLTPQQIDHPCRTYP